MSHKDPLYSLWMLQELHGTDQADLAEIISEDGELEITGEGNSCWDEKVEDILGGAIEHMKNTFLITDKTLNDMRSAAEDACDHQVPMTSLVAALNVLGIRTQKQREDDAEEVEAQYMKALAEARSGEA